MHQRRALLEAIKTQLQALPKFAGVFIQAFPPRNRAPAITVWPEGESVETLTVHGVPRPQERAITVNVTIWAKGSPAEEKAGSDLDSYAELLEQAMTCPAGADDLLLLGTSWTMDDEEPELHAVTLTYSLAYQTVELNPT